MAEPRTIPEPFTMNGTDFSVLLQFNLAFAPLSITENGVPQSIGNSETDRFSPGDGVWYWRPNFNRVFKIPAVSAGVVVIVTYQPDVSNVVVASSPDAIAAEQTVNDPSGIPDPNPPVIPAGEVLPADYTPPTPSGIYAATIDYPQVQDITTADAVNAAKLRATTVTPLVVTAGTLQPGASCGMNILINRPVLRLNSQFVITEITKTMKPVRDLGAGSCFERSMTCAIIQTTFDQEPADTSGITTGTSTRYPIQPYVAPLQAAQRTAVQPDPVQQERPVIVLGTGAALAAGNPLGNRYEVVNTGTLIEIHVNTPNPPVNQRLVIDIFQDGVSILSSRKIQIAPGDTSTTKYTVFANSPALYRMNRGSLLTFGVLYLTGSGTKVAARNVTIQPVWSF